MSGQKDQPVIDFFTFQGSKQKTSEFKLGFIIHFSKSAWRIDSGRSCNIADTHERNPLSHSSFSRKQREVVSG
jgi:hypothetical protein